MTTFTRGNVIDFSATFTSTDAPGATPSAVGLTLSYLVNGAPTRQVLAMTLVSGAWTVTWDSSAADGGSVDWVAKATGGLIAATQGTITLLSNRANSP